MFIIYIYTSYKYVSYTEVIDTILDTQINEVTLIHNTDIRYADIVPFFFKFSSFLIGQVLRLFHFLVKFGYYGSDDIKALLRPLLNLVNGKLDKPFPPDTEKGGRQHSTVFTCIPS